MITETWLSGVVANLYVLNGYFMLFKQRPFSRGEKICVYVRDLHQAQVIDIKFNTDLFEHFESLIKSNSFNSNIVLSAIYRPPCKNLNEFINKFPDYLDLVNKHCPIGSTAVICGDFNINLLQADSNQLVSSFINTMYNHSLFPNIHWSTRVAVHSASLIDNIFCNNPIILNAGIILTDISDHFPVFSMLDVKKPSS